MTIRRLLEGVAIVILGGIGLTLLAYLWGYFSLVNENHTSIRKLQESVAELNANVEKNIAEVRESSGKTATGMENLKLFVAQAHPDRDPLLLESVAKLENFNREEAVVFDSYLATLTTGADLIEQLQSAPKYVTEIMKDHNITSTDVSAYIEVSNNLEKALAPENFKAWGWSAPVEQIFFSGQHLKHNGNTDEQSPFMYAPEGKADPKMSPKIEKQPETKTDDALEPAD